MRTHSIDRETFRTRIPLRSLVAAAVAAVASGSALAANIVGDAAW